MQRARIWKRAALLCNELPAVVRENIPGIEPVLIRCRGMWERVVVFPDYRIADVDFENSRRKLHGLDGDRVNSLRCRVRRGTSQHQSARKE